MTVLNNEVLINAPRSKVWGILSNPEALERYDPVVLESKGLSDAGGGVGAERDCSTANGGWFKERVSIWEPEQELEFALYACNQPMKNLTHSYRLEDLGGRTKVSQVMRYSMKYGILGLLMDAIMVRRVADKQIKLFMAGLKRYAETDKSKREP